MLIRFLFLLALLQSLALSQSTLRCDRPLDTCDDAIDRFPEEKRISIKYANKTITNVEYFRNFVNIDITHDTITTKYRLVVCGCQVEQVGGRATIFINPTSLYIDSGPSLALYHFLVEDNLSALTLVGRRESIFNQDIRDHITNGGAAEARFIADSGSAVANYSKVQEVNPSLSIIDSFSFEEYDASNIDVPFVVNAEAQEKNPLARAEWLKIFGLVLDRVEDANEEFDRIERRYNEARERAEKAVRRPTVLFNSPFGGNWTQPVADEYIVQLVRDANADYRYFDEEAVAGESGIQINISTAVRDFGSADVFLQANSFPGSSNRTLEEYLDGLSDPEGLRAELEKLKAVRCATVWSSQKRVTEDGLADDFFESAIVRPDLLLSDFVQTLHPNLDFEDRETFFLHRYGAEGDTPASCPNTPLLNGTAPEGEEFVDTKFVVPNLDRFEIADRLEDSVIPEIEKRVDGPFEVFFHHEDVSEDDTVVTVRVQVNSTEKESFEEEPSVIFAMRDTLGDGVRQRDDDGNLIDPPEEENQSDPGKTEDTDNQSDPGKTEDTDNQSDPGKTEDTDNQSDPGKTEDTDTDNDGGGLSGGAIAGIVIGVLAVAFVVGFLALKRKSRGRTPVPDGGMEGFDQDITV